METVRLIERDHIVTAARTALEVSVDPDLADDRFDGSWADSISDRTIAVVATTDDAPAGFATGTPSDGMLQLDCLVTCGSEDPDGILDALISEALTAVASASATGPPERTVVERIEIWSKPTSDAHRRVAESHGFTELRALHQMRCSLPVDAPALETRPFVLGSDDDALRRVNNRAFAAHPDQGNMSQADLEELSRQPWFDPEGIRLYDADGVVAGFCWTKIHSEQQLGEIYAIGIDPDFHGQGLGKPMTNAGLAWMADRGLKVGMLYVEADNVPAIRTYEGLGFDIVRTDRAWVRT